MSLSSFSLTQTNVDASRSTSGTSVSTTIDHNVENCRSSHHVFASTAIAKPHLLSLNFSTISGHSFDEENRDTGYDVALPSDQEQVLITEVLAVLTGVTSDIITNHLIHSHNRNSTGSSSALPKIGFMINNERSSWSASLKDLTLQISELASHYHCVTRFVEASTAESFLGARDPEITEYEKGGLVIQALKAALRNILKDYLCHIAQVESTHLTKGDLTLQKLWFIIQPDLQVMSILSSIVNTIQEKRLRGGQILSLLHLKTVVMVGNSIGHSLCYELAQKASKPYFTILENWIYKGIIKDRFDEFFVRETETSDSVVDNEWNKRYKIVPDRCPSFLSKVNDQVLKAGKYLNVIRLCGGKHSNIISRATCSGRSSGSNSENKLEYSIHERIYVDAIEKAYSFASKTLLDLLLNEYDLMKRLLSVKHYLLMDQGDFIVQFMDLTESELCKKVDDLNPVRLDSLLQLALRTSSSALDPYKDNVGVQLFPNPIEHQLSAILAIQTPEEKTQYHFESAQAGLDNLFSSTTLGIEGFAFSYEATWPMSLVLNARALVCYQMIFRHLFYCKHVERQLCKVWIHGKGEKTCDLSQNPVKCNILTLRHHMLNFVQNLLYYMTFEVIEPSWHVFLGTMSKVTNLDEVISRHEDFVNSILHDTMLTNSSLFEKVSKLLSLCLKFCGKVLSSSSNGNSLRRGMELLKNKFSKELISFLREIPQSVQNPSKQISPSKVCNIIHRINFNGSYTEALEQANIAEKSVTSCENSFQNVTFRKRNTIEEED